MDTIRELFMINRPIVLFGYGQIFFIMGMAIFLQSRRYSRLKLARDLRWLAAFGVLHGIHEWGNIFIPIQAEYLPEFYIHLLLVLQIAILGLSFGCLFMFGAVSLESRWPFIKKLLVMAAAIWVAVLVLMFVTQPSAEAWHHLANVWSRYLLAFPGSLFAGYGLRYQTQHTVAPLKIDHIYQMLQITGVALGAYAVFGGLMVPAADFFPANILNKNLIEQGMGFPVEVVQSLIALVLAATIIRALEIFEIELDQLIETMEVERIQAAERERIGQEIHDGAIQAIYSAGLIMQTVDDYIQDNPEAQRRLDQSKHVLNDAIQDLRSYMVSLSTKSPDPLIPALKKLVADPRFQGLVGIDLKYEVEPDLNPRQINHVLAIVQESLSNAIRHANARHVKIDLRQNNSMMELLIADDGRGFSLSNYQPGYGLRSQQDRARLLGGSLHIDSQPGHGTKIRLLMPSDASKG